MKLQSWHRMLGPRHIYNARKRAQRHTKYCYFRALRLFWKSERLYRVSILVMCLCVSYVSRGFYSSCIVFGMMFIYAFDCLKKYLSYSAPFVSFLTISSCPTYFLYTTGANIRQVLSGLAGGSAYGEETEKSDHSVLQDLHQATAPHTAGLHGILQCE